MSIDLLITYVNYKDRQWMESYRRTVHRGLDGNDLERFRAFGTLRYLMRGAAEFMPWIDRIVLVVASESQIPFWVNRKTVRVVTHREFIPPEFLPTFNSCTIESFFWNIKDLGENIIYANDDTFPIAPLDEEEFFQDGIPCTSFNFYGRYNRNNLFRRQCKNGANMIYNRLIEEGKTDKENPVFFKPEHTMTTFRRESLEEVGRLCGDIIGETTSKLRSGKNINQHIYSYYQYFTDNYVKKGSGYRYMTFVDGMKAICRCITEQQSRIICINDCGSVDYKKEKETLKEAFEKILPNMCRYENGLIRLR